MMPKVVKKMVMVIIDYINNLAICMTKSNRYTLNIPLKDLTPNADGNPGPPSPPDCPINLMLHKI